MSYHKLRVTVEVEIPDENVDQAYEYLNHANEGFPDPHGCSPIFWAIDEAVEALKGKMSAYTATDNVRLQIVLPQGQEQPLADWERELLYPTERNND